MKSLSLELLSVLPQDTPGTGHYHSRIAYHPANIKESLLLKADSSHHTSLSEALNSGLRQLSGDICLITDHETQLYPEAAETIKDVHQQYRDYDLIFFRFNSANDISIPHCHYPSANKPHEQMLFLHFYEISFKRSALEKQISFDEDFGPGTTFPFGESYTFVQRALKLGLRVHFSPRYIGQHPDGYLYTPEDEINRLRSLGAINCKIHGWNYVLNYLNVSIKRMEKREALYGNGLAQLNKLNAYLLGAREFIDQGKVQSSL
jgi:glycosyltransferase involved in cell wall biosynthesis